MAWSDPDSFATKAFGPYISTIIIATLVAFLLPTLVHFYLYRAKAPTSLPSFLVLGPSGSGKTSLVTLVCPHTPHGLVIP